MKLWKLWANPWLNWEGANLWSFSFIMSDGAQLGVGLKGRGKSMLMHWHGTPEGGAGQEDLPADELGPGAGPGAAFPTRAG